MQGTDIREELGQLVIRPSTLTLAYSYGLLAVFGGLAILYSLGITFLLVNVPNDLGWWERALIVGLPSCFALALAWWVSGGRQPFCFDRGRGVLLDGERPLLSLASVESVAVRLDPGETADFFVVELVLDSGQTFALRRESWPLDRDVQTAAARAARIAGFLGVSVSRQGS